MTNQFPKKKKNKKIFGAEGTFPIYLAAKGLCVGVQQSDATTQSHTIHLKTSPAGHRSTR